jgi:hypothetical protein
MRKPMRNVVGAGIAAVFAVACLGASADTIYLHNGVAVDGIVRDRGDGIFEVKADERTVIYRAEEIASIEKNEKTGALDLEAVKQEVAAKKAELEALTGLTEQQRDRVDALITELRGAETAERANIRDTLVQLHADWGIQKYLAYLLDYSYSPSLLEATVWVSPGEAIPFLTMGVEHGSYEVRAMAIDLLGRIGHRQSAGLIARGLVDHAFEVRLASIYALATINARQATPALISMMTQPDVKLSNAAKDALKGLWQAELGGSAPDSVTGWTEFWERNKVGDAIEYESLVPMIQPDQEFVVG